MRKLNRNLQATCEATVTIEAAKDATGQPTFSILAYTGGAMKVSGWNGIPVVIDLAGLSMGAKSSPILLNHDSRQIVGHSTNKTKGMKDVRIDGTVSGAGAAAMEVVESAKRGFPWQASVGVDVLKAVEYPEGRKAVANGMEFEGPVIIARKAKLYETSFVALGADEHTSAKVAAEADFLDVEQEENNMDDIKKSADMEAAKAAEEAKKLEAEKATEAAKKPESAKLEAAKSGADDIEKRIVEASRAEAKRQGAINAACKSFPEIAEKAIAEGLSVEAAKAQMYDAIQARQGASVNAAYVNTGAGGETNLAKTLEAGLLMAGGFSGNSLLKSHGEQAVNYAAKEFRSIGCQRVIMEAAWANGFTGRTFNTDALRAAFSTASLPGILSNVANKQLLAGFESVENDYTKICTMRPVKDFKTITSYRLTASMEFEEVGPGGELKHGEVGEESYTNQAKTYGKMFAITRTMFINDDLDALFAIPRQIGRGSGQKLNKVFWTEFLDNSTFFTEARGNYATGTDTALAIAGLTAAEVLFRAMKESTATGAPRVAHKPQILLVPSALSVVASQLMTTALVNETTTADTPKPNSNPHVGKYTVVSSGYLDDSAYTGYSAAAYYLLANPMDMPTVELCFLNGVQTPTVERADADFNTLGVQFRGYFDFGASKQDYRGGIKMLGEAEGS
jgi:hypothetical protein